MSLSGRQKLRTRKGLDSSWRKNKKEGRFRLSAGKEEVILRGKREKAERLPKKRVFQTGPAGVAQVRKGPGRY